MVQNKFYAIKGANAAVFDGDHWPEAVAAGYQQKSFLKNAMTFRGPDAEARAHAFILEPAHSESYYAYVQRIAYSQWWPVKVFFMTLFVTALLFGCWYVGLEASEYAECQQKNLKGFITTSTSPFCTLLHGILAKVTEHQITVLTVFFTELAGLLALLVYWFHTFLNGAPEYRG